MDDTNSTTGNLSDQGQPFPPALTNNDLNQPVRSGQTPSGQSVPIPPKQPTSYHGSSIKEQKERLGQIIAKEKGLDTVKYKEYQEVEVDKEVEGWVEKMEKGEDTQLQQPVMDDYGQILLDNANVVKPQIILPLEEEEVRKGLHHKVVESIRWLAEWCLRMIKLAGKRVEFKKK